MRAGAPAQVEPCHLIARIDNRVGLLRQKGWGMRLSAGLAIWLTGCIALGAPWASRAQTAPAPASAPGTAEGPTTIEGVTVTARRPPLKDMPGAVTQFVRSHGAPSRRTEQIARWDKRAPICVKTVGLDPAFNAFVTRRVEAVASSVGAPVDASQAGKPCIVSIEIAFAEHPQDLASALFKRDDDYLGYHYPHEVQGLRRFEPPIKAWYATGTRGHSGFLTLDTIYTATPSSATFDSRLHAGFSSEFVNVLVIADRNLVSGREVGPISDYMAMLVLTQPRSLVSCDPLPSILDLMSPDCSDQDKPKALTPADLAYLRALYATSSEQTPEAQRNNVADLMQRSLTAPQ